MAFQSPLFREEEVRTHAFRRLARAALYWVPSVDPQTHVSPLSWVRNFFLTFAQPLGLVGDPTDSGCCRDGSTVEGIVSFLVVETLQGTGVTKSRAESAKGPSSARWSLIDCWCPCGEHEVVFSANSQQPKFSFWRSCSSGFQARSYPTLFSSGQSPGGGLAVCQDLHATTCPRLLAFVLSWTSVSACLGSLVSAHRAEVSRGFLTFLRTFQKSNPRI